MQLKDKSHEDLLLFFISNTIWNISSKWFGEIKKIGAK